MTRGGRSVQSTGDERLVSNESPETWRCGGTDKVDGRYGKEILVECLVKEVLQKGLTGSGQIFP